MKTKAALFPTIFAIAMAVASIGVPIPGTMSGTPWLTAAHTQFVAATDQNVNVDNLAFFLWGLQYTVVGRTMQSKFVPYDPLGDFPMFSMYAIILAIIIGIIAIISNRFPTITIKGKDISLNVYSNPMTLLVISTILMIAAIIYLDYASKTTIIPMLSNNNYKVNTGIGFQFMGISVAGFLLSIIMTHINKRSGEKDNEKDSEEDIDKQYIDEEDIDEEDSD